MIPISQFVNLIGTWNMDGLLGIFLGPKNVYTIIYVKISLLLQCLVMIECNLVECNWEPQQLRPQVQFSHSDFIFDSLNL